MKLGIDVRSMREQAGIGNYTKGFLHGLTKIKNDQNQYLLYFDQNPDVVNTIQRLSLPQDRFILKNFIGNEIIWYLKVWYDLKKEKIDYLYSTNSTLFSFFLGIKTILTVHDLSAIIFPKLHTLKVRILAGKFFLTYACRKAKFIFVDSNATKNDLETIIPVSKGKITVNYCGLSDDQKYKDNENRFTDYNFPYILYLGTIEPRKNLVRLIEAYDLLNQRDNTIPKLVIAGNKGWFYEEVYQKVAELGLQGKVIFTGFVNDTEKDFLFKKSLIFVFPSIYEGFGLPVAEAMKKGIPVLTSNISSLPEIVGKDYPFLVNPEDVLDIKDKLERLLRLTPKEKEKIVLENKQKASRFTWGRNAEKWLKIVS